ncbi:MAG: DUF4055 domain-containing protein, partial [Methyloligellaceae bacterium]
GKEQFVHVRVVADERRRDGFGEAVVRRVRIFNREQIRPGEYAPATWELWEEQDKADAESERWARIVEPQPMSIGIIPLVAFVSGRREGTSWTISPPLKDAAELQVELFHQESALKNIDTLSGFPMLAGNGVHPPTTKTGEIAELATSPHTVLFAPPGPSGSGGTWSFIEPAGSSAQNLADRVKTTSAEIRELGRTPLTAQSGNVTVINSAVAAQKGNSAIQAWALMLVNTLENALEITGKWMRLEGYSPAVEIDTEFDLGIGLDDGFDKLLAMRQGGDISRDTLIAEAKRRGILEPGFDAETDLDQITNDLLDGGSATGLMP